MTMEKTPGLVAGDDEGDVAIDGNFQLGVTACWLVVFTSVA